MKTDFNAELAKRVIALAQETGDHVSVSIDGIRVTAFPSSSVADIRAGWGQTKDYNDAERRRRENRSRHRAAIANELTDEPGFTLKDMELWKKRIDEARNPERGDSALTILQGVASWAGQLEAMVSYTLEDVRQIGASTDYETGSFGKRAMYVRDLWVGGEKFFQMLKEAGCL